MNLNSFIFNPPKPTYDLSSPNLRFVQNEFHPSERIPVLSIKHNKHSEYKLVYFHANGEDAGSSFSLVRALSN